MKRTPIPHIVAMSEEPLSLADPTIGSRPRRQRVVHPSGQLSPGSTSQKLKSWTLTANLNGQFSTSVASPPKFDSVNKSFRLLAILMSCVEKSVLLGLFLRGNKHQKGKQIDSI